MFRIEYPFKKEILACGAQTQANFCLTKKNWAYIVNDLGSLTEQSVLEHYQREIERLTKELKIKPKVVTHDLHPEYNSTKYAQSLSQKRKDLKYLTIQHHHAHVASCIGENGVKDKVIGVVFDGEGKGLDGNIWGGEFFVGDLHGFKRMAHLKYTPIPNGTKAIGDLRQLAASYLYQSFGENFVDLEIDFVRRRQQDEWQIFKQDSVSFYYSSSVARLFDGVCALVGLRERVEYEGQGVTELERIVNRSSHVANRIYEFTVKPDKDKFLIHPEPVFLGIIEDLKKNISKSIISAAFHNTIIEIARQLCHKINQKEKVKKVILTGSVFQNKVMFNRLKDLLTEDGFQIIEHKHFSCNDSNISFGQAVLADAK